VAGSKVVTDPGKLGPELLELLSERALLDGLGHGTMLAEAAAATVLRPPGGRPPSPPRGVRETPYRNDRRDLVTGG
jgi:hypothetical protein